MGCCHIGLFGIKQYGVDINGFVHHPENGLCVWMQRRSKTKQTWPGKLDNFVRMPNFYQIHLIHEFLSLKDLKFYLKGGRWSFYWPQRARNSSQRSYGGSQCIGGYRQEHAACGFG